MNRARVYLRAAGRSAWCMQQLRGSKILGADVREGNVIKRTGRMVEVLKTQHTQQGRGGATIQVELRDVQSGLKSSERLRTSEALEKVFIESKRFTYLYLDGNTVFLMEPKTFEQVEVPKRMFGSGAAYLTDGMPVNVQYADGEPLSASVPQRVTCKVADAEPSYKGQTATPMSHHAGSTIIANQAGSIPSLSRSGWRAYALNSLVRPYVPLRLQKYRQLRFFSSFDACSNGDEIGKQSGSEKRIDDANDEAALNELREIKRQMDELDKKYDSYFTVEYALRLAESGFKDSDDEDEPSAHSDDSDSTDPLLVAISDISDISDNDDANVPSSKIDDVTSSNLDDNVAPNLTSIDNNDNEDEDDYDD